MQSRRCATHPRLKESSLVYSSTHAIVQPRLIKPTLDPAELCSYRPISNLSFISKTVERVVAARFSEHVETKRLLPSHQSAYRAHHSTEIAITAVHDELVRNIDSGKVSVLVLLDLSAAFDTVDYYTLLEVLGRRFGVKGTAFRCQGNGFGLV
jgi:Reverse transcriptase (RNA-dependent DNA polymerase)